MRKLLYFIPALIMAGLGAAFYLQLGKDASVVPSALIDQAAPDFTLASIDGYDRPGLATTDLKGRITVVNVFASWCIPCVAEHPLVDRLAAKEGVTVHGINYRDRPSDASAWLARLGDPYAKIGADADGKAGIEWGVYGVPETFVIDGDGTVLFKHAGALSPEIVERKILPLIKGAK